MAWFGGKVDKSIAKLLKLYRRPHRYRPLKQLGEGGLAAVSSCFDTYTSRVVALKELKAENLRSSFLVQSFVNEVKLISYLHHPGLVSVFDTFLLDRNRVCYTMTLVEGDSLAQLLETDQLFSSGPRLSLARSLDIFTKMAETMAHVHDRGVIHLDIKPENVMVGRYGEVMIMDWGNARLYDPQPYREYLARSGSDDVPLSEDERRNVVLGTPLYMSPEQTGTPRNLLTPASDIFSAGVVLYEMLTGVRPFQAGEPDVAMEKVRTYDPLPVHELNRDVPARLSQICEKMLAKEPCKRYETFRDVVGELSELRESGQAFSTRTYKGGELIFSEGDPGEYAFTVLSGKVEIVKKDGDRSRVLATLGKGEVVGELAIFTDHPRTAAAKAVEDTTIRVMGADDVKGELEKLRPWVGDMVRALSERFIGLNEKLLGADDEGPSG